MLVFRPSRQSEGSSQNSDRKVRYLSRQGPVLVLLLCGSDKSGQDRAIKQAIDYLNDWKQRGKP